MSKSDSVVVSIFVSSDKKYLKLTIQNMSSMNFMILGFKWGEMVRVSSFVCGLRVRLRCL